MTITFNRNNRTITTEDLSYSDLIRCVIAEEIKDEEFVSMDLGNGLVINGIGGLTDRLLKLADDYDEAMTAAAEEEVDSEEDED